MWLCCNNSLCSLITMLMSFPNRFLMYLLMFSSHQQYFVYTAHGHIFSVFLCALGRVYTAYCPKPRQKTSVRTSVITAWTPPRATPTSALTSSSRARWVWRPTGLRRHAFTRCSCTIAMAVCVCVCVAGEAPLRHGHGRVPGNAHWNGERDQLVDTKVGQEWCVPFPCLKKRL